MNFYQMNKRVRTWTLAASLTLGLGTFVLPSTPIYAQTTQYARHAEAEADAFFEKGYYELALKNYLLSFQQDRQAHHLHYKLGLTYYHLANYQKAEDHFNWVAVYKREASFAEYYFWRGATNFWLKNSKKADAFLQNAKAQGTYMQGGLYLYLARNEELRKQTNLAREYYLNALNEAGGAFEVEIYGQALCFFREKGDASNYFKYANTLREELKAQVSQIEPFQSHLFNVGRYLSKESKFLFINPEISEKKENLVIRVSDPRFVLQAKIRTGFELEKAWVRRLKTETPILASNRGLLTDNNKSYNEYIISEEVFLEPGINKITVWCKYKHFDRVFTSHEVEVHYDPAAPLVVADATANHYSQAFEMSLEQQKDLEMAKKKPKIWCVSVGISDYAHEKDLQYSKDDVYLTDNFLVSVKGGAIPEKQRRLLVDSKATKPAILAALNQLARQAGENDIFMFYFAGHGIEGYFVPYEGVGTNKRTLLSHQEVLSVFDNSKAKQNIIIADACHAGSLEDAAHHNTRSLGSTFALDSYYKRITEAKGGRMLYLLSAKSNELAIETSQNGQGVFTFYLLEGLKGKADFDKSGYVEAEEISAYVLEKVAQATGYRQNPIIGGDYDPRLPLSLVVE
ncbi:caspase family protein [Hugenholtzia roseola]|uniref:caspase family protein n=1 Tax=Hugenholtzia roseola TaxID=1002 RepID=UPI0003F63478|nr:caspase family protein [Hugenholtzia roseola]